MMKKNVVKMGLIVLIISCLAMTTTVSAMDTMWDWYGAIMLWLGSIHPDRTPHKGSNGDPVDLQDGNFTYHHTDLVVPSPGLNLVWERYYDSNRATKPGPFGYGWSFGYDFHLEVTALVTSDSNGFYCSWSQMISKIINTGYYYVSIKLPNGYSYIFIPDGKGGYVNPPNFKGTLVRQTDGNFCLTEKTGVKYVFNERKIGRIIDRNNNSITFQYSDWYSQRLIGITDTVGRKYTLSYNSSGKVASITDAAGRVFQYSYDEYGQLSSFTEPNGAVTQYKYQTWDGFTKLNYGKDETFGILGGSGNNSSNTSGGFTRGYVPPRYQYLLSEIVTPKGNSILKNTYDDNRRVSSQIYNAGRYNFAEPTRNENDTISIEVTNRRGAKTSYQLDKDGQPTSIQNCFKTNTNFNYTASGNIAQIVDINGTTYLAYDDKENVTQIKDALNQTVNMTYNNFSEPLIVTDKAGHKTEYIYDAKGNLTQVKNALGVSRYFTYNDQGELMTVKDENEEITKFTYDSHGYLSTVTDPMEHVTHYQYDDIGRLQEVTDAKGNKTSYEYDYYGVKKVTDAKGNTTSYTYDIDGNLESVTDALNRTTTYQYDQYDRLTSVTDPLGNKTSYTYDLEDNLETVTDANGNITKYEYDGLDRVTKVTDAMSKETVYTYDAVGNVTQVKNAKGNLYNYTYDKLNRLLTSTDPMNRVTSYSYNAVSLPITITRPDKSVITKEYDVINRLTKIVYPDATKVYTYDARNLVTAITQGNQSLSFEYNKLHQLTKATDIYNRSLSYTYDEIGNCTGVALPNAKTFTYQYDELHRLKQITNPEGDIFSYTYDAVGRRTQLSYPNGKTATYDYDDLNRLTALNNGVQSYSYTYDKMFNIKSITTDGKMTGYDYDSLYRLTTVTNPDKTQESYTYDEVGNRMTKTVGEQTTAYTYDAANRMLTAGSAQCSYDALGNTTKKVDGADTYEYGYNSLNNLTAVKKNAQEIAKYGYDPLGRRVSQTSGGQTTQSLWDDYSLVGEYSDGGVEKAIYTIGSGIDEVLAINNGSANYAYSDHLGSVTAILDGAGNNVSNRSYDAFGNVTSTSGDYQSSIGFTGREVDGTGLAYLRNRYYNPGVGRFIGEDPIKDGMNWYVYCRNNPLIFVDPLGLNGIFITGNVDIHYSYEDMEHGTISDIGFSGSGGIGVIQDTDVVGSESTTEVGGFITHGTINDVDIHNPRDATEFCTPVYAGFGPSLVLTNANNLEQFGSIPYTNNFNCMLLPSLSWGYDPKTGNWLFSMSLPKVQWPFAGGLGASLSRFKYDTRTYPWFTFKDKKKKTISH